ncbi:hypothetical protein [Dyella sp. 2HG41-7]|uniref:hypothetical protein n=1 Tax=Dyella sp. 2HG41-7 TaxID=2883239 RepID=UPI001F3DD6B7|nr:hypothetical protein [Dyella sp. 2HG41-7]
MQIEFEKFYVPALYATVGSLLAFNISVMAGGAWTALLPITIQALIIVSVMTRRSWAYIVVRIWSAICIVGGASIWLAVLLRGGEFSHSAWYMTYQTLALLLGVIFFKYAKAVLSQEVRVDVSPQQIDQQEV